MTASSRPSANRAGAALVVVCCASDDAESLRDALTALREDGLEVELVEGLDHDPKRLTDVIDQRGGEGLYVLCRSPRLGRETVEELREILLARHIPFARTLTVAVGGRGALADRIRSGLRRASTRTTGPNRAAGPTATPELVATSPSRPLRSTHAAEDDEPTRVGKPGVPGPLDTGLSRPVITPPKPRPPAPAPAAAPKPATEVSVVEVIDDDLLGEDSTASRSIPVLSAPDLDLSDLDQTGSMKALRVDTTAVGTPPPLITGETAVGPAPVLITGDTVVGQRLPPAQMRELAERWPPLPAGGPARMPSPPAPSSSPAPPGSPEHDPATTPLPRLAPQPRPLPPSPAPAPVAPASFPSPSMPAEASLSHGSTAASTSSEQLTAPSRGALPWVLAIVALLLLALVIGLAVSMGDDTEDIASNDPAEDAAPPSATPDADADADLGPDEPMAGPPAYPVVDALKARKVRALDVLLIATDPAKPSDFSTAAAYCDALEIEGLRGWRLPHVGELSSMSDANMIARDMYWSNTAADTFGDDHMAWNGRRRYAERHGKTAVAVCVRGGASGT